MPPVPIQSFKREGLDAATRLSDEEWAIIEPLLPNKPRGVARVDDGAVIDGILALSEQVRRTFDDLGVALVTH